MVSIADIEGAERLVGIVVYRGRTRADGWEPRGPNRFSDCSTEVSLRQFDADSNPLRSAPAELPHAGAEFTAIFGGLSPAICQTMRVISLSPQFESWRAWIAAGALTSRRLTEIFLSRIDALGPRLECFATVTAKRALAEADAADTLLRGGVNLGPLHGLPYGLKDLFDAKGITTGWGAEPYRDRVPSTDATIVRKLRAAGAVLLGKTTVGALAYNDIWYGGWTRNPWNLNEGSSGSSAGSASATAAGLCAFSIGTETLGSITSPSQRCGTTGLRPTFGRVSRAGGMALCWSLDKVGPICRFVEDTGVVLAAINGADGADRFSIDAPFRFDAEADISGLRLGYLPEAFGEGATEVDHAALAASRRLGVEVVEVSLPPLPYEALMNVLYAEAAAAFEDLTLSDLDDTLTWQDDGAWPNTFVRRVFFRPSITSNWTGSAIRSCWRSTSSSARSMR